MHITADPVLHDANGAWIITEFHDSILVHRRIGHYRRPAPIWSSLVLVVEGDSIHRYGTLTGHSNLEAREARDTLLWIDEHTSGYVLHDPANDLLTLHYGPGNILGYYQILHYRRLTSTEQPQLDALRLSNRSSAFRDLYHEFLLRELFVGRYDVLDGNSTSFTIDTTGTVTEHARWKSFEFHDYFGTLHPYVNDLDALWFSSVNGQRELFNWHFRGDTLHLTALVGDGDSYGLGKTRHRYLKR